MPKLRVTHHTPSQPAGSRNHLKTNWLIKRSSKKVEETNTSSCCLKKFWKKSSTFPDVSDQAGLIQEEIKEAEEDGKNYRPHFAQFRSKFMIQQSQRDFLKIESMRELKDTAEKEWHKKHLDYPQNFWINYLMRQKNFPDAVRQQTPRLNLTPKFRLRHGGGSVMVWVLFSRSLKYFF